MPDPMPHLINSESLIDDLLDQHPLCAEVFNGLGMACVGCEFSRFHSVGDAAVIYHLNVEQLLHRLYCCLSLDNQIRNNG